MAKRKATWLMVQRAFHAAREASDWGFFAATPKPKPVWVLREIKKARAALDRAESLASELAEAKR